MASATVGVLRVLFSGNTAEFEAAVKRASGVAQVWSKDLQNIGRQATQVGTALTKTLTLPILAVGAGSVKAAMDFESSFANVAKTVDGVSDKAGKLTKAGEDLAKTFRQMAKEIPATTDELNKIAALGGQMGVPIDQLDKFTRNVAALGVAVDGISTEEAAAGLAMIGNITGDGATKIDKYSSALVHLGNNSAATEADILEFTKRLMGAGNAAGMTVPEVMALGTAMADVGINAEAGGSAMSMVINKISVAVSEGGTKLDEFAKVAGRSAEEFAAIWKSKPIEAMDLFVKGLGSMKDRGVDLNLTMGELGTEGIRVADTLKRLAGAGDGVSTSLAIANEGFATGNKHLEEAEKKYATTANQLKILWNQIRDIGITIGNALLPAIKSAIGLLNELMPIVDGVAHAFAALPGPVQGIVVGLALAFAAAGPLIWAFGQLALSASALTGAFGKTGIATRLLTAAFSAMQIPAGAALSTIGRFLGPLALLVAGLWAVKETWDAFNRSTEEGIKVVGSAVLPFGLLIKLVDALSDRFPRLGKAFSDIYTILKNSVLIVIDRLGKSFETIQGAIETTARVIATAFTPVFDRMGVSMERVASAVRRLVIPAITAVGAAAITSIPGVRGLLELLALLPGFEQMSQSLDRVAKSTQRMVDEARGASVAVTTMGGAFVNGKFSVDAWRGSLLKSTDDVNFASAGLQTFGSSVTDRVVKPLKVAGDEAERVGKKATEAVRQLQAVIDKSTSSVRNGLPSTVPGTAVDLSAFMPILTLPNIASKLRKGFQEAFEGPLSALPGFEIDLSDFIPPLKPTFFQKFFGAEFGQQLGGIVGNAFRGGSVLNAVSDGASLIGSTLLGGLAKHLTTGANAITGWLGGMISSALPIIGSLLGPLVEKIAGFFDKIFGNKGRDVVKDFAASMGGFDALHAQLATLGSEGERLWIALTQGVGRNNPQQAQAAIDAITAALGRAEQKTEAFNTALGGMLQEIQALGTGLPASLESYLRELERAGTLTQDNIDLLNELAGQGEADWKKIQAAVERYGGDIAKLGGTFQAQRLHDSWQQVIDDMDLFERGGMDAVAMLDLTKGKIIELVQQSVMFGTTIPENMRPWIQKLIEAGELVDDNGVKITDIGKLTFGETLQTSLQNLTDEIKRLILAFQGVPSEAGKAATGIENTLGRVRIKIPIEYEDPGYTPSGRSPAPASTGGLVTPWGIQYRALGGLVNSMRSWKRGTDTELVAATPGEGILNTRAMSVIGPRQLQAWNHGIGLAASDALTRSSGAAITQGGPSSLRSVTILEVDKRELGRAVADVLPGELRRLGVRVRA